MNRFQPLLAGAALAFAAAAVPTAAQSYDWTGFYAGLLGGWSDNTATTSDIEFEGTPTGIPDIVTTLSGAMLGVTGGYNHQAGQFVLGVEGDLSWSMAHGEDDTYAPSFTSEADMFAFGTLRGRAGFAADQFVVFVTGGLAAGGVTATIHDVYGQTTVTTTDTEAMLGWTAGAGAEIAVSDTVSIKGEWLYYDLGTAAMSVDEGAIGWQPIDFNVAMTGSVARIGLNIALD